MINNYEVYTLKNELTFDNQQKDENFIFSPTVLSEPSMKVLLDSVLCWELYVEYTYSYTGYDSDDDMFESSNKVFNIEELPKNILAVGCLSVNSAIVIDDEENFVGILLCKGKCYNLLSPFLPTYQTIKLHEKEIIYDHREEETTATFSLRKK